MNVPPIARSHAAPRNDNWPVLLTVPEAAQLLRTTARGVYAMVECRQVPGVVRIGRRVLFRTEALLHWVHQKSVPSLEE